MDNVIQRGDVATCPQCKRDVRVSEPYAFRGMHCLAMTLSCGHVVARPAR